MSKIYLVLLLLLGVGIACISFTDSTGSNAYRQQYHSTFAAFAEAQQSLLQLVRHTDVNTPEGAAIIRGKIAAIRRQMKAADFWMRYLEPVAYKKINGPLPVEWETEVFEKFEKPYKREGAGLTLAALYLEEEGAAKDSLCTLLQSAIVATETYAADSITSQLDSYHHFYLCNRLFLLNLAAIYTTGFECPDTARIVPELEAILRATKGIYTAFNSSFTSTPLPEVYLALYNETIDFVATQPNDYTQFDHFRFLRDFVNPLFAANQQLIRQYRVRTKSYVDYTLNKSATSFFSKSLYNGQNPKGIFLRVDDSTELATINRVGKQLFYDPILSGNNQLSCNSCHKSTEYFTDTVRATAFQFNGRDELARNTPTLIGARFNHLLMLDGKHFTLQNQAKEVILNPIEMGGSSAAILQKILSCKEYKTTFAHLLKLTPQEKEITLEHVASAITFYYSKFSENDAPFDEAMNGNQAVGKDVQAGFNLFMGKAQCATCHFVPQFNGVKPPYVGSEFEVLGVPADKQYKTLSADKGRWEMNNATEMLHAIRTGTVRNAAHTMPYMHNGVFTTLEEVVDFYDDGGGAGHGLQVPNQTLSSDSLHLTPVEKKQLITFIQSLSEEVKPEAMPARLPLSSNAMLNRRKVGGSH